MMQPDPFAGPRSDDWQAQTQPTQNGLCVASLVLGICSWFVGGIFCAIPGVILGHKGRAQVRGSGGRMVGEGMALAGLILSYLNLALTGVILILVVVFFVTVAAAAAH